MNLTQKLGAGLIAGAATAAALAPSTANAGDYVQVSRWGIFGAGHTTTFIHTEPSLEYFPERFCSRDAYGNIYEGTRWSPRVVERETSRCTTTHVDWDKSFLALPGNTFSAVGRALTPPRRVCHDGFVPMYIAPVQPCYPVAPPCGPCR